MATPNRVLFVAYNGISSSTLWASDGTTAGTSQILASTPNTPVNPNGAFVQLGNRVLFGASDGIHGYELWATDGFSSGTSMLLDINPGTANGIQDLGALGDGSKPPTDSGIILGSHFIFNGYGVGGNAVWITDGTTSGTTLLKQTIDNSYTKSSNAENFVRLGDKVLFDANGTHSLDLWITDGTTAGTVIVRDLGSANVPENFAGVSNITALGGTGLAVFRATDTTHGLEIWVTNGTSAGTALLKDINPGLYPSDVEYIRSIGTTGKATFTASVDGIVRQLWVTDGTSAGTQLLQSSVGNANFSFSVLNNRLLYEADDGHVYATDGTVAGTVELIPRATYTVFYPQFSLGSKAFFSSYTSTNLSPTLWVTDGTVGGTQQLSATITLPYDLKNKGVVLGTKFLFEGDARLPFSSLYGNELFVTDGTVAGTGLVADINPGSLNSSDPQSFAVIGNTALFRATDAVHGTELWSSDGNFANLVDDINPAFSGGSFPRSGTPSYLTAVALACFAEGTRIATEAGLTPVENLKVGDPVQLWNGGTRPIIWIGHRTIDIARHPRAQDVTPIRVAPHAFGPGLPHTALRLSPDHAIYCHGVLVPVRHLVNGTNIAREAATSVTYYHIELDAHDVLVAEGLACESYLDGGDTRDAFEGSAAITLHPVFGYAGDAAPCAPVVSQGVALQNVRALVSYHADLLARRHLVA